MGAGFVSRPPFAKPSPCLAIRRPPAAASCRFRFAGGPALPPPSARTTHSRLSAILPGLAIAGFATAGFGSPGYTTPSVAALGFGAPRPGTRGSTTPDRDARPPRRTAARPPGHTAAILPGRTATLPLGPAPYTRRTTYGLPGRTFAGSALPRGRTAEGTTVPTGPGGTTVATGPGGTTFPAGSRPFP